MPSMTREIPNNSDQARRIRQEVQRRVKLWQKGVASKLTKWEQAEEKVLAYIPERDVDAARRNSRENGLPQYTTIQIPYSYAVVMASHTYLTSVFMGRDPIFQYRGLHGEAEQQTQAVEALISYQVYKASMQKYLHTWLYDSLKYGVGITCCWWNEKIDTVTIIGEQPVIDPATGQPDMTGAVEKVEMSQRFRTYAGNEISNTQPQDFVWDTRVTMREFQKGEFCGQRKPVAWNEVIRRSKQGYYCNVEYIRTGAGQEIIDQGGGSSMLERPDTWGQNPSDGNMDDQHPMVVQVYELGIEIIPKEFGLSKSDYPEKWVFTVTQDYSVLLGCQPLGMMHCQWPYSVIPMEPEGYGLTTRGLPEILDPIQNTIDWLINSHFYNVRASLNDRWIVDPSRVVMKDLTDPLPGKIIRLKPEAWGTDPSLVAKQFPTSNVTQSHLQDFATMLGIGERVGGVNDQIMGMLSTGGRKTATEVRTSTSFGINRLKTLAEFCSMCGFDPLSMQLVANSQQYFDMEMKLKVAGDLAMNAGPGFLMVSPDMIAGGFGFLPVDGTLPIDRFAQVELWERMMQSAVAIPQIGMGYDWQGIFTWIAQLAGLKNINQFKVQITPDQQLMMQAQQGNSVPLGGAPKPPAGPSMVPQQAMVGAA